mmetsp:Transcript_38596/g.111335  ORF Transcript_38596/g.111335 Transcript_38596/m.111335 type:complete len:754 (-) Transcript_38596:47-2308(-)
MAAFAADTAAMPTGALRRVFGTYKKSGPALEVALHQALGEAGDRIFLVDTAAKYGNQHEVARIAREHPGVRIGSKVNRHGCVAEDLAEMEGLFGGSLYRVLLHRPMGLQDWRVLERAKAEGRVKEIGVCNYSADLLEQLLGQCDTPPDVVQNELHPCLATPVVSFCRRQGIRFEAHSVMAANAHLEPFSQRWGVPAAQLAIAYCLAQGADICFSTGNLAHLRQDLAPEIESLLSANDVAELARLAYGHPIRLYRAQGDVASQLEADAVYAQLRADFAAYERGEAFSDLCLSIPKSHRGTQGSAAKVLAKRFFPDAEEPSSWQKFDYVLHKMRKVLEAKQEARREERRAAFPKVCALPRAAVADPDALPVDIPDAASFRPFLDELRALGGLPPHGVAADSGYPRRFEKGTLFPDGRMDLCKQVIQPCFEELCEVVQAGGTVKHFLLGNNVVFRDGTPEEIQSRMAALQRLIRSDPKIETWYLAGNGISAVLSEPVAEAFRQASHLKALWLKMNPVQTGALHFGALAAAHPGLELLDLFNTGLRDEGLRAFRDGLGPTGSKSLRHLYLSINDIQDGGAVVDVIRLLPNLESLFLGINFLRDEGAALVLEALVGHGSLRRLEIGANGLTDASLPALQRVVSSTGLQALTLGNYKSTRYFDGAPNAFTDVAALAQIASGVEYLQLDGVAEGLALEELNDAVLREAPNTFVFASQGLVGQKKVLNTAMSREEWRADKARLAHPQPYVDNIQSIYRNAM